MTGPKITLAKEELGNIMLPGSTVSVLDLCRALCDVLDGEQDHDIHLHVGEGEDEKRTIAARAAARPHWLEAEEKSLDGRS